MVYLLIFLELFFLIGLLNGIRANAKLQPLLDKSIDYKRWQRISEVILIAPLVITATIVLLYIFLWRSDPQLRFAHMFWVLGFWLIGTLSMFSFAIPVRLKLARPYTTLLAALSAVALAIYFTPLPRFAAISTDRLNIIAAIGILNISLADAIAYQIRKKLFHAGGAL